MSLQFLKNIGFALIGWAFCGAIMSFGPLFLSMQTTLIVHLILGPTVFGVLCWQYYRRGGNTRPVTIAVTWTLVTLLMDAGVVAPFFEKSDAMFHSLIGFWFPMILIFIVTFTVGRAQAKRHL
jgi:Na+/proline symporter